MTILELKDQQALLQEANDKVFEKVETEKRAMSEKEESEVQNNIRKMDELELKIQNEERKMGNGKPVSQRKAVPHIEKREFSLLKTIRAMAERKDLPEYSADISVMGRSQFKEAGINIEGGFIIPSEVRADIKAGTATAGQEIVAEDKKAIIPPLVDKLVFAKAGVTMLTGLVGNVSVPSYAGTTVAWKGEVAAADDGGGAFSEVELSPKRLTAYINVSKQFLLQDGVGAERMLMENIANAVARKLESTILGVAVGSATQPQGMGYKVTTGADTKANAVEPTWATIVGLETAVDSSNALDGNLAYITNGGGRGILKTAMKEADVAHGYLVDENGLVNGYPLLVTNSASAVAGDDDIGDLVVFGNWADLVIGQWGGYDITVDPYTLAPTGQVKITINAYFDAKGLRGELTTGVGTQNDYYAKSFASTAIK